MYFRGQRKSASDVSLSECIETGRDGNALSLMDVICSEEDLFEQLSEKEIYGRLHAAVNQIIVYNIIICNIASPKIIELLIRWASVYQ